MGTPTHHNGFEAKKTSSQELHDIETVSSIGVQDPSSSEALTRL
jgi:hypothetical protein